MLAQMEFQNQHVEPAGREDSHPVLGPGSGVIGDYHEEAHLVCAKCGATYTFLNITLLRMFLRSIANGEGTVRIPRQEVPRPRLARGLCGRIRTDIRTPPRPLERPGGHGHRRFSSHDDPIRYRLPGRHPGYQQYVFFCVCAYWFSCVSQIDFFCSLFDYERWDNVSRNQELYTELRKEVREREAYVKATGLPSLTSI